MASVYDKLDRTRKPRVHITYKVETGGEEVLRELPFVVGVLGDFAGDHTPDKTLTERSFVSIDSENFNDVMAAIGPRLADLKVDNTLAGDGSEMKVNLAFNTIDDFEPARIVDQIPELKTMLEVRNKLRDLMAKADRSERLEEALEEILSNKPGLAGLAKALEGDQAGDKTEK